MFFFIPSDISQHDVDMLEEQQWYEEEAVEAYCIECMVQKIRKETEAKVKEETKKQKIAEEKKKKTLEYIQQLQNEMIAKSTIRSQVVGSKYKKITSKDKKVHWPSKKTKGKYCKGNTVKIEDANPCKRYMYAKQNCLVYYSR